MCRVFPAVGRAAINGVPSSGATKEEHPDESGGVKALRPQESALDYGLRVSDGYDATERLPALTNAEVGYLIREWASVAKAILMRRIKLE